MIPRDRSEGCAGCVRCVVCTGGQRRGRAFTGRTGRTHELLTAAAAAGPASHFELGGRLKRVEQARDTLTNKAAVTRQRVVHLGLRTLTPVLLVWDGDCISVLGLPEQSASLHG